MRSVNQNSGYSDWIFHPEVTCLHYFLKKNLTTEIGSIKTDINIKDAQRHVIQEGKW